MKHWTFGIALVLAALAAGAAAQAQTCPEETYGTAVGWVRDAAGAAEKAKADGRLVMMVHLAGDLDDADKT